MFIEVKTRTTRDVKPAQAAVDRDKQRELSLVARDFLRQMPPSCQRGPQPARLRGMGWNGGSMYSPYTMSAEPAGPHSSCYKMRFPYRTIIDSAIVNPAIVGVRITTERI